LSVTESSFGVEDFGWLWFGGRGPAEEEDMGKGGDTAQGEGLDWVVSEIEDLEV
jgi:hypothetical protein